jgi:putative chitinase
VITLDQLKAIMPRAGQRAGVFLVPLKQAMQAHEINSPLRQAAFLAQIAHESGSLRYTAEIASGAAYEFRKDLGNTIAGDGKRYKGRGLIQITGRSNYRSCSIGLFGDPDNLLGHPEMLETVTLACDSAAWWWNSRGLNEFADAGRFERITRIINGGLNGFAERLAFYTTAKKVLV